MAVIALGHAADPAGDPHPVVVCVAVDHPIIGRTHRFAEAPLEQLAEELPQLVGVFADHLEMDYRCSHHSSSLLEPSAICAWGYVSTPSSLTCAKGVNACN